MNLSLCFIQSQFYLLFIGSSNIAVGNIAVGNIAVENIAVENIAVVI